MLLSEVTFEASEAAEDALASANTAMTTPSTTSKPPLVITAVREATTTTTTEAINEGDPERDEKLEQVDRASERSVYLEVIIGVLTAVTLLLLFLFVTVLVYSRRQKFLSSPASRTSLNPFPVQINMKVNLKPKISSKKNVL